MSFRLTIVTVLAVLPAAAFAQEKSAPSVPAGVTYLKDIEFGRGGQTPLMLDLAKPENATKPLPCIVVIHGGGWRGGHFKQHVPQILDFAKRGFVSATVQYRLVPQATFPAQIEDVKCAVRHLRAHAEKYGIDKERIGAIGFSAGAHLSMLLGTMDAKDGLEGSGGNAEQSSKVQAVVAYFGPTDLAQKDFPANVNQMIYDFLGGTAEARPDIFKAASPITYVDKADAPILIYHGTKDALVPHSQATLMADAMTKVGLGGRVELLLGANHGWGQPELDRTVAGSLAFFREQLQK